jgi:sulfur-oxidizing protein SoxX
MGRHTIPLLLALLPAGLVPRAVGAQSQSVHELRRHDAAIAEPLAGPGDVQRGRALAADRNGGGCVLCHAIPDAPSRFMGDVGPSLAGIGGRLTAGELRLRIVDSTRVQPNAAMPAYYRTEGLHEVAAPYRGRTILTAQQVEDVVAYLQTLK